MYGAKAFFLQVLLGEGYYVDRTSKQTIDILRQRGKSLDSQVHSLEADITDLKTEQSFFSTTASEAEVGFDIIKIISY